MLVVRAASKSSNSPRNKSNNVVRVLHRSPWDDLAHPQTLLQSNTDITRRGDDVDAEDVIGGVDILGDKGGGGGVVVVLDDLTRVESRVVESPTWIICGLCSGQ